MRRKMAVSLLFICFFICFYTTPAMGLITARQLTTADGLADNTVRYILQDSKGFLWMSTLNGLSRYDGNSFICFYPDKKNKVSLADHRIRSITEDHSGFLWIDTYADRFSCYDLKNSRFVDFENATDTSAHYNHILVLKDAVWLWGRTDGCMRIVRKDDAFYSEIFDVKNGNLLTNHIHFVTQGHNGTIYVGTNRGLYAWMDERMVTIAPETDFVRYISLEGRDAFFSNQGEIWMAGMAGMATKVGELPLSSKKTVLSDVLNIDDKYVLFTDGNSYVFNLKTRVMEQAPAELNIPNGVVIEDNKRNYWVQNKSGKLYYINSQSGAVKVFLLMQEKNRDLIYREQYHILHDSEDRIWITTYGNGLFMYNQSTDELRHYLADRNRHSVIGSNYLHNIMEDRTGGVWISSEFSGVSHLTLSNENTLRILPESEKSTSLNAVRMLKQLSDGEVWVGTRSGGLSRYNPDLSVQLDMQRWETGIYTLLQDKEGQTWLGTRGKGLFVDNKQYLHAMSDSTSLSGNNIYSVLQDRKGRIWIGTFGYGLNLAVKGVDQYTFRHFQNQEYGQRWIRCMTEDQAGKIWVGTSGGVFVFHPDSLINDPFAYSSYSALHNQLRSDEIRAVYTDSKGRVWMAETGQGFCVCTSTTDYNNLHFEHYDTQNGLISDKVQAFVEDKQGMIWISTEYGLSRFNPDDKTFENYFFSDFMLDDVYSENCAVRLNNGCLAFGSAQGVVVFDPVKMKKEHKPEIVTFTDLKINGVSVYPGEEDSPLESALPYVDVIRLNHDQNSFVIEFSTLNYADLKQPKFSYKLAHYDTEWSVPSGLNFAAYKNLSPGSYTLHVKTCNTSGLWSEQDAVMKIIIYPPFWKTYWAYFIYLLVTLLILFLVSGSVRQMNALRNKIQLEEQLNEYKLTFFTNISHEFRTPLTLIQGALERFQRIDHLSAEGLKALQVMTKSTDRLLRLINQLLEFRKMQNKKLALSLEKTDVIAFLHEIFLTFSDVAEQKNMDFRFSSSVPSYDMYIDKSKLDKVAYNLLSNAFKYTPVNGAIVFLIQIDEAAQVLQFQVLDTGVGIPKEKQKDLFTRFMQSRFSNDSIGVGLSLSAELVSVHKGTLTYKENKLGGSVFTVSLPIDESVYEPSDFLLSGSQLLNETEQQKNDITRIEPFVVKHSSMPINKQKILIIEDDNDIRALLAEEIGIYFDVETAENGIVGLEKARTNNIDLIVCDVLMPQMNGFEVTRKLKSDFTTCHIPIILLTALTSPENQLEGIDAGANAYIQKPFSIRYLLTRVLRMVEQYQKIREKFTNEPGIAHDDICMSAGDKEFAKQLAKVLEENLNRSDFTVKEFAQQMHLSQTVFYTKVRGLTGYAPVEYLRIMRVKKAAELLLSESLNVADVAYQVGFNDPLYFSRCFKAQFGKSPSFFQKENRKV